MLNNTIHEKINHEESVIKMLILVAALPHHKSGQGAQEDNPETHTCRPKDRHGQLKQLFNVVASDHQ